MDNSKIKRINELAAIAGKRDLTEDELVERDVLRREFLESVKSNLRAQLESIEVVDDDSAANL